MKLYKIIPSIFILSNILLSQDATLCPPRFLDAYFYDEEVYLVWEDPDSSNFGTVLFDECFLSCSLAVEAMNIEHLIDNESAAGLEPLSEIVQPVVRVCGLAVTMVAMTPILPLRIGHQPIQ